MTNLEDRLNGPTRTPLEIPTRTMLHIRIPPELWLQVLSFLPIQSILSLRLSSQGWTKFIAANEASIYHATAILHGFAEPHKSLEQSKGIHVFPCIEDVTSWKEFCSSYDHVVP